MTDMEMAVVRDVDGWYGTASGGVEAHYAEHGHPFDIPTTTPGETLYIAFY